MDFQDLMAWYDFTGRVVVIPGGAGILGGEMACALIGCGANVVIMDYDPSRADRIKDRLECGPGTAQVVFGDVLDRQTLVKAAEKVLAQYGRVDALINAAGGNSEHATTRADKTFFDLP
jgi:NAD(P)-dependent dehydrogenase (short-subunit alcohol dehydrogenase family)